jgi:histidinol-phosphate/aromatic aminotransferase/cobyric acid decarboxylase-like protein/choline kinase
MQAVILTAGRGRRMEPLSRTCHKALLEIGGSTILGRAIDSLVAAGVGPITVVTGYRADDITRFIASDYPTIPVRFVHNDRYETTNNIVSLALALESLSCDDDVILIECDLLFEPRLIKELVDQPGKNVALVDRYRTGMDGTVVATEDGYVAQVFPTASQGRDFRYDNKFKTLNIYRFDRTFCHRTLRPMLSAYANHVDDNCYYELVLGMLANIPQYRIVAQVVAESDWVEVDDPNDLSVARFVFDPAARPALLDRTFGGHWAYDVLDFSLPRNSHFPPAAMHAAMRYSLPDVITGYGSAQDVLDEKLALFLGCKPGRPLLLGGASQAYPVLRHLYRDSRVAMPAPTFGEYARSFPQALTYPDSPGIDAAALEAIAAEVDLLVLVNPNNPTGTTLATQAIYDLAARTPGTAFLVDESFLPFSGQPSLVGLLEAAPLPNVTVLTSLGKALGVPGLRLGFLYSGSDQVREAFAEFMPIWGVNALAEFFLELTLKFRPDLDASITETVLERARMRQALADLPLVQLVHDSGANFLLVELTGQEPELAAAVRAELLAGDRIEIKDVSAKFADRRPRLRLAVRTREDNDRLLLALRRFEIAAAL